LPSNALLRWQNERSSRLREFAAQTALTLSLVPPSDLAEENLRGLAALLCAHFQGFCRDLYTETTDLIIDAIPALLQGFVRRQAMSQLKLDTGNPNLQSLTHDFNRFGFDLKSLLDLDPANGLRLNHLALLNKWRNYVVHHGVTAPPGPPLALAPVQAWQTSCSELAVALDQIMYDHLLGLLGVSPW
jgi:hypothetical protein